jgi:colicin import membrane protein
MRARRKAVDALIGAGNAPRLRRRRPGGFRAVAYALLVHGLLLALLLVGLQWSRRAEPPPIQAYVAEPTREPEKTATPEPAAPERERKAEESRRAVEAKRQEEQRQAEAKRRLEEEQKRAAQKRRAEEEKKQAEVKRKEEEAKRRKEAERSLKENLAAEERTREEAAQAARLEAQQARYADRIAAHVMRYSRRTPGLPPGLKCTVRIRLTATGNVLNVAVMRSSGNAAFDRDAENSVRRAEPLPVPEDKALFERVSEIEFVFNPQD